MPGILSLFQIETANPNKLHVSQIFSDKAASAFGKTYSLVIPLVINRQQFFLGYDASSGKANVVRQLSKAPWFTQVGNVTLGTRLDAIEPFLLGNQPHLMCYQSKAGVGSEGNATHPGTFTFYSVAGPLNVGVGYSFRRNHELGITRDFTTVKIFNCGGQPVFLGYNGATGYVAMFTLSVTSTSPPFSRSGTPPLIGLPKWSHPWAPGWTRFAFFQLGGETFFFKTNTVTPNTNIDHILDDVSTGTVEVSSQMQLRYPGVMDLQIVQPLIMGNGEPYFIGYKADGTTTINRFHADCQGWTEAASFTSHAKATQVATSTVGDKKYIVIC